MPSKIVTIVIPTFNRLQYLARAIHSCLQQHYQAVSIIVVDNASSDGTQDFMRWVTRNYQNVSYHRNPVNVGAVANFDIGSKLVMTEYFSFLSDDDILLPCFLERTMTAFKEFPAIGLAGLSCAYITGNGRYLGIDTESWRKFGFIDIDDALLQMTCGSHLTWTTCVFKTSAFRDAGGINATFDQCIDLSLLVRLATLYPIYVDQEIGGYFVRHKLSSCNSNGWLKLYEQLNQISNSLLKLKRPNSIAIAAASINKYAKTMLFRKLLRDALSGSLDLTKSEVIFITQTTGRKASVRLIVLLGRLAAIFPFSLRIDLPELAIIALSFGRRIPQSNRKSIEENFQRTTITARNWLKDYDAGLTLP